ncbi:hypothetical protein [Fusobacterium polymorphum]|uniref:hypothetical protein n=1 Tax=Fusobacterium nucleatum subsp. polymorphum TaxID=76857 RepID=UPI00300B6A2A
MVDYVVFNSNSLPFQNEESFKKGFGMFYKLISKISSEKYYTRLMVKEKFQNLLLFSNSNIFQIRDNDLKNLFLSFINNRTIEIDYFLSPEPQDFGLKEYIYAEEENKEMAYVHIFDTFLMSFYSSEEWGVPKIKAISQYIKEEDFQVYNEEVIIDNISQEEHLEKHSEKLENKKIYNINMLVECLKRNNLNSINFLSKVIITEEVQKNIDKLPSRILEKAVNIIYNLNCGHKTLNNYTCSDESDSVKDNPHLSKLRHFKFDDGKSYYVFKHIKNLPDGYRMYYKEENNKIFICYIGPHLITKNNK